MDHKKYLLEQLRDTISEKLGYEEFQKNFYNYYITKVSDQNLSEGDHNFFTAIQEKFEYTFAEPLEEDRKYGYISYEEFIVWLQDKIKDLLK